MTAAPPRRIRQGQRAPKEQLTDEQPVPVSRPYRHRVLRGQPDLIPLSTVSVMFRPALSRSAIYRAAKAGDLPTVKLGRRLYVPKRDLQRLLDGEQ